MTTVNVHSIKLPVIVFNNLDHTDESYKINCSKYREVNLQIMVSDYVNGLWEIVLSGNVNYGENFHPIYISSVNSKKYAWNNITIDNIEDNFKGVLILPVVNLIKFHAIKTGNPGKLNAIIFPRAL
ncbi:MAG: hypothetical protein ABIH39_06780 [Candidatus Margulisiibacteriota bacterium]